MKQITIIIGLAIVLTGCNAKPAAENANGASNPAPSPSQPIPVVAEPSAPSAGEPVTSLPVQAALEPAAADPTTPAAASPVVATPSELAPTDAAPAVDTGAINGTDAKAPVDRTEEAVGTAQELPEVEATLGSDLYAFNPELGACLNSSGLLGQNQGLISCGEQTSGSVNGVDLSNADLRGVNLSGSTIANTNLSLADLVAADLSNASLKNVNLNGAKTGDIELENVNVTGSQIAEIDVYEDLLEGGAKIGENNSLPAVITEIDAIMDDKFDVEDVNAHLDNGESDGRGDENGSEHDSRDSDRGSKKKKDHKKKQRVKIGSLDEKDKDRAKEIRQALTALKKTLDHQREAVRHERVALRKLHKEERALRTQFRQARKSLSESKQILAANAKSPHSGESHSRAKGQSARDVASLGGAGDGKGNLPLVPLRKLQGLKAQVTDLLAKKAHAKVALPSLRAERAKTLSDLKSLVAELKALRAKVIR